MFNKSVAFVQSSYPIHNFINDLCLIELVNKNIRLEDDHYKRRFRVTVRHVKEPSLLNGNESRA